MHCYYSWNETNQAGILKDKDFKAVREFIHEAH